jgi:hypothetical protein
VPSTLNWTEPVGGAVPVCALTVAMAVTAWP